MCKTRQHDFKLLTNACSTKRVSVNVLVPLVGNIKCCVALSVWNCICVDAKNILAIHDLQPAKRKRFVSFDSLCLMIAIHKRTNMFILLVQKLQLFISFYLTYSRHTHCMVETRTARTNSLNTRPLVVVLMRSLLATRKNTFPNNITHMDWSSRGSSAQPQHRVFHEHNIIIIVCSSPPKSQRPKWDWHFCWPISWWNSSIATMTMMTTMLTAYVPPHNPVRWVIWWVWKQTNALGLRFNNKNNINTLTQWSVSVVYILVAVACCCNAFGLSLCVWFHLHNSIVWIYGNHIFEN